MKKIYIILSTLFLFIFHVSGDIKIDKIAVINLEKVMDTVFSGNSGVIQNIKKEKEEMQKKLDKIKENINKLEEFKLKEKDTSRKLTYQKRIEYKGELEEISQELFDVEDKLKILEVLKKSFSTNGLFNATSFEISL